MNKVETKEIEVTKTLEHTIVTKEYGIVICTEKYVNGELKVQTFKPGKLFHNGYEPERMGFEYYGGKIDTHDIKDRYLNSEYDLFPEQVFVTDLESFSDFDNLYCIWVSMDGNIYRLTKPNPLPTIRSVELHGCTFNLGKCQEVLGTIPDVYDINIIDNCSPNWDICGRQSLYFKYKADQKETIKMKKIDSWYLPDYFAKKFKLNKFRLNND